MRAAGITKSPRRVRCAACSPARDERARSERRNTRLQAALRFAASMLWDLYLLGVRGTDDGAARSKHRTTRLRSALGLAAGLLEDLSLLGVRGTYQERLAKREDRAFDRRNRTDTRGVVALSALSVSSPNKSLGADYEPTCARALRLFLTKCEFPSGSVFVDLGCGKGRALLIASHLAFKRVVGVEFARELSGIAASNVQAYRQRHPDVAPIDVIEADVAEYEVKPDENVFYMFNPFGPGVIHQVVRSISSSVARHSRPVWIVYNHPDEPDAVGFCGAFVRVRTFRYGMSTIAVYASRRARDGKGHAAVSPPAGWVRG